MPTVDPAQIELAEQLQRLEIMAAEGNIVRPFLDPSEVLYDSGLDWNSSAPSVITNEEYYNSLPPVLCVACGQRIPCNELHLVAGCSHHYCSSCVITLAENAVNHEAHFPVKCCDRLIPLAYIADFLDGPLLSDFERKSDEFKTPPSQRVYCSNSNCAAFLGNAMEKAHAYWNITYGAPMRRRRQGGLTNGDFALPSLTLPYLSCTGCGHHTCVRCRQALHMHVDCPLLSDERGRDFDEITIMFWD